MANKFTPTINLHATGRFYTTLTHKGKKTFIYGHTKEEVLEKYTEARYMCGQGYNISDSHTMKDYTIRWFNTYKKGKGAIKTQEMYMNAVNVHIIPTLGSKKIKEITTTDIQETLNSITSSYSLQHKVRITLNQIFKKALSDRLIMFNPVVGTDRVETPPPERSCYSPIQRNILTEVLKNHKIFPLAYTVLHTGMRLTEAIALIRSRDLDLKNNKIYIRESTEFENNQPKTKDTKTLRGVREIPIPSAFANWLGKHLEIRKSFYAFPAHHDGQIGQTELKNMQRRANSKLQQWFDEAELVQNKDAAGEEMNQTESALLLKILSVCGEQPVGNHRFNLYFRTLRHTYCTELFDLGIDEVSAAAIMGHSVSVMREIYTHIQGERRIQTEIKIGQLYVDKKEKAIPISREKNAD